MKKLTLITLISLLIIGSPAADIHVDYSKDGNEPDTKWIHELFQAIDAMDADGFVEFLSEDVRFKHGNQDFLYGRSEAHKGISGLFDNILGINHELSTILVSGNSIVVYGTVTYTRKDGSTLSVPVADIWTMADDKIQEYLIFVDNHEL